MAALGFASSDAVCTDAEYSAVEQPDEWQVGDDDSCSAFPDIPIRPSIAERFRERVPLVQGGCDDYKNAETEDSYERDLFRHRYLNTDEHWYAECEHEHIRRDIEDRICDEVVGGRVALRIWCWDGPISCISISCQRKVMDD